MILDSPQLYVHSTTLFVILFASTMFPPEKFEKFPAKMSQFQTSRSIFFLKNARSNLQI